MVLSWILLASASTGIAYQDFKDRLISVWLIIVFSVINIAQFLFFHPLSQYIENTLFCLAYFLFSFCILFIYFYLKTKKFEKIIDTKIGLADVILFISIGSTIDPINLVYFFTGAFILSILIQIAFFRLNKQVPLAGFLVLFYLIYFILEKLCFPGLV